MNYERYQPDSQKSIDNGSRRAQLANRNASSFNIIGFNPDRHDDPRENEKIEKKQKQAVYRHQLDNMVSHKDEPKLGHRTATEGYEQIYTREADYGRTKHQREPEQRYIGQTSENEEARQQASKKRMQQEIADANKRAADLKSRDKERMKANDLAADNQRIQDSLYQTEKDDYRQRETKRRMNEENNTALAQQVKEHTGRKQHREDYTNPSHENGDYQYKRAYEERNAKNPLAPSHAKMNQGSSIDSLSNKMGQLSMDNPFAKGEDDSYNYNKQRPISSRQQHRGDKGSHGYQDFQGHSNQGGVSDYEKNRTRAHNTGYNIINFQS